MYSYQHSPNLRRLTYARLPVNRKPRNAGTYLDSALWALLYDDVTIEAQYRVFCGAYPEDIIPVTRRQDRQDRQYIEDVIEAGAHVRYQE